MLQKCVLLLRTGSGGRILCLALSAASRYIAMCLVRTSLYSTRCAQFMLVSLTTSSIIATAGFSITFMTADGQLVSPRPRGAHMHMSALRWLRSGVRMPGEAA